MDTFINSQAQFSLHRVSPESLYNWYGPVIVILMQTERAYICAADLWGSDKLPMMGH